MLLNHNYKKIWAIFEKESRKKYHNLFFILGHPLSWLPKGQATNDRRRSSWNLWAWIWKRWICCCGPFSSPKFHHRSQNAFIRFHVSCKFGSEIDFSWSTCITSYWIWTSRPHWKNTIPIHSRWGYVILEIGSFYS